MKYICIFSYNEIQFRIQASNLPKYGVYGVGSRDSLERHGAMNLCVHASGCCEQSVDVFEDDPAEIEGRNGHDDARHGWEEAAVRGESEP